MPAPTIDRPISPLRQRLIDDMNLRRFSRETQRNYIRDVGRFATFRVIQVLLGHAKLENTAFYTKVATRTVRTVTSPLDKLGMFRAGEVAPTG